ncbi:MAG: CotH kinase family protein [Planctomycetaceae bacterium]
MGGPGGPGGMMGQERKLVEQYDRDGDGRLNRAERDEARKTMQANGGGRRGGFGPPGGMGGREEPASPGAKISPADVEPLDTAFYDRNSVRTLFLNFEGEDWEAELEAFNNTDVEVPATLIVDGKELPGVGVHFRGMSSFGAVSAGHKRSLNLSIDFTDEDQKVGGYKTLNLLNSHEDPSFLHTVLYFDIARNYIAAPQANFVRVVINGENWGLYVSAQQFNKEFLKENYGSSKGTRWKVQGSPQGRGGLEYLGEDLNAYKRIYSMKSDDDESAWKKLAAFCKVLNETPAEQLEEALTPILDIDEALWFLALENALINSDGYWVRASDYCIFLDAGGKFHIIPHDANETMQPGMGPGMGGPGMGGPGRGGRGMGQPGFGGEGGRGQRPPLEGEPEAGRRPPEGEPRGDQAGRPEGGGRPEGAGRPDERGPRPDQGGRPEQGGREGGRREGRGFGGPGGMGGGGVTLDPLVGLTDASKPLRSKLLAIPALKQRYLSFVRTIAEDHLDWQKLGPKVEAYASLIRPYVEADTKKLSSFDAFLTAVSSESAQANGNPPAGGGQPGFGRGPRMSLRQFADQRREFLLNHAEVKAAPRVDYQRPEPKELNAKESKAKE